MENKGQKGMGVTIDPTIQAAALDIKVVALTSLLIENNLVTEKEVIEYTQAAKNAFIEQLDASHPNTIKDIDFLENYFKDYK